jgi:hypothetical protein
MHLNQEFYVYTKNLLSCCVTGNNSDFDSEPARAKRNSSYFLKQEFGTGGESWFELRQVNQMKKGSAINFVLLLFF